jgi:hypothetical protein
MDGANKTNSQKKAAITRTGKWKAKFIETLANTGNVTLAIESSRVDRPTAYHHKKTDPAFAMQWANALDRATDILVGEARRRGFLGIEEPVFGTVVDPKTGRSMGTGVVGVVKKYSDNLLMFLIKKADPSYRENYNLNQQNTQKNTIAVNWDEFLRISQGDLPALTNGQVVDGKAKDGE